MTKTLVATPDPEDAEVIQYLPPYTTSTSWVLMEYTNRSSSE
jgi:hypothetical protein